MDHIPHHPPLVSEEVPGQWTTFLTIPLYGIVLPRPPATTCPTFLPPSDGNKGEGERQPLPRPGGEAWQQEKWSNPRESGGLLPPDPPVTAGLCETLPSQGQFLPGHPPPSPLTGLIDAMLPLCFLVMGRAASYSSHRGCWRGLCLHRLCLLKMAGLINTHTYTGGTGRYSTWSYEVRLARIIEELVWNHPINQSTV